MATKSKKTPEHVSLDVFLNPDVHEPDNESGFYMAEDWSVCTSSDCSHWEREGKRVLRAAKEKNFRLGLYAPNPDLAFSFVANFCRAPELEYSRKANQSPLKQQTMRNDPGNPVRSNGSSTDHCGKKFYYYPLVEDAPLKNAGTFFVTVYTKIEAGQGAGKVFACDPEMQVEERSPGGGDDTN